MKQASLYASAKPNSFSQTSHLLARMFPQHTDSFYMSDLKSSHNGIQTHAPFQAATS